ncbi:hypothetical protein [Neobacillus sp. PS2-9]|uniref:hypothetical protein n=1 Tax=Neobacillus sp. PS2-9 TaxID=3070676 RepID=UPI0027DF1E6D|nr:hypothetical protein [Neobacillus sp. PS2-9]WML56971.1 hypothetical protein RCG25_18865 [Neobacillus sp. PS2-9]
MMKRVASITYRFVLECNVGILFLSLFYINKKEFPPILFLLLTCMGGMIFLASLLVKIREKGKWVYIVTIFPLLLYIYYQDEHSLFFGLIIGLFIFWRGISLYDDGSLQSEAVILLLSFMVGLIAIIYSALSHYPFQDALIYLLISQIILALLGSFYGKWFSIQTDKTKFAFYFMKILAGFFIIGIGLTFLLKYVQLAFFSILHVIVMLFSNLIANPLLSGLEFIMGLFGQEEYVPKPFESDMENEAGKYQERSFSMDYLLLILIVVVVGIIGYLIYKKRLKQQAIESNSTPRIEVFDAFFSTNSMVGLRKRGKPPEEYIRREIYNLEKYAHKLKLGRISSESLEEWWNRIGLVGGDEIIDLYEKVRYGHVQSSTREQSYIKAEIHQLKQQLIEIHKKGKH